MKRKEFLGSLALLSTASLLPFQSFASIMQENISTEELLGKGNPSFVKQGLQLREEATEAFQQLQKAANKEGISPKIVSGYRSFERQKQIWNAKYSRYTAQGLSPEKAVNKIIEYSTVPGTSRHHWGTDMDIIDASAKQPADDLLVTSHYYTSGVFCPLREWMDENAKKFGFYQVYTKNFERKGFKHEPWHYSYGPLSIPYLKTYRKLNLVELLSEENLKGKSQLNQQFIKKYKQENLLDINSKLL